MENENVRKKIETYPEQVRDFANEVITIIYEVAKEEGIDQVEESLKWGEPSFRTQHGSPIRFDWKSNHPDNFFIFFNCKTILVETFRELYGTALKFEGNRAIVLNYSEELPKNILKHCITLAFDYHRIKHLPFLGA